MSEITEDLVDTVMLGVFAIVLVTLSVQFIGAAYILLFLDMVLPAVAMIVMGTYIALVAHAMLTDGLPHKALTRVGLLTDLEPASVKEERLWGDT